MPTTDDIEVRTYFARGRNALVARASFSELFAAWYLHRMDCGLPIPPGCDQSGREALAAITLHCAGRPWKETCAWTAHFPEPRRNIFAACDNATRSVVANVFTENIRAVPHGLFYSDVIADGCPPRRSSIEFQGDSLLVAAEEFYRTSEQRPARFFWLGNETMVMVSAQPDCDTEWLDSLDTDTVSALDTSTELALLEKRGYRFECGCSQMRMLDVLCPVFLKSGEDLFGGEETIRAHCPRCGARHAITREAMEAHLLTRPQ